MPARRTVVVEVVNAVRAPVPVAYIRSVLRAASRLPEIGARLADTPPTVAVRLTDDAELRRLHRDFSAEDSATDVLSFAGVDDHLGDLAISWPAVVKQAEVHGHPPMTELAILCVHGFIHLLGWDHATSSERREMTRVTVAALALAGITPAPGRL